VEVHRKKVLGIVHCWLTKHESDFEDEEVASFLTSAVTTYSKQYPFCQWETISALIQREAVAMQPTDKVPSCNHEAIFLKAHDLIMTEKLLLSDLQAAFIAAIQYQIEFPLEKDDPLPTETPQFLLLMEGALRRWLPERHHTKQLPTRILEELKTLRGIPDNDAKHLYIKACLSSPRYGFRFFEVKHADDSKKKGVRTLGVGPRGIVVFDEKTQDSQQLHPIERIQSWSASAGFFIFTVVGLNMQAPADMQAFNFSTKRGEEISSFLSRHSQNATLQLKLIDQDLLLDLVETPICLPVPRWSPQIKSPSGTLASPPSSLSTTPSTSMETLPTVPSEVLAAIQPNLSVLQVTSVPEEMARQMTLIEHEYFRQIGLVDVLDYTSKRQSHSVGMEMIGKLIRHFNAMSSWVASELVTQEDDAARLTLLRNFINVARMCRKYNNFNGLMEIMSGLNSSAVQKLGGSWDELTGEELANFAELNALLSSNGNFAEYRHVLDSVSPPCLPFFGAYLTDVTFVGDGNADIIGDGKINYAKVFVLLFSFFLFLFF